MRSAVSWRLEPEMESKNAVVAAIEGVATEIEASFGGVQGIGDAEGWLVRLLGGGNSKAGMPVSEWGALSSTSVWACVTLIADCIAMLPIAVYQRKGEKRTPQPEHPVAQLLSASANEDMGASSMIRTQQMHTLLWGNGYAEIERTRGGEVVGLWPLLPDRTRPEVTFPASGRRLDYATQIDGRSFKLPPSRVLHLMGYSFDGICGISPIYAARNAIGLGLAMEQFGSKFFANDAKSGGVLMYPGKLSDKAKQNVQDSFHRDSGAENAHKVKVLEEGMKYIPTTVSPEDSQFLGSREFQLAEAARIFRVSLVLLSSLEGSTVWGTGIEQLMIGFVTWTLGPWIDRWEEELGRKLLTPQERKAGFYIKFNVNALLRGDMAARAAFYKAGITDGWLSRNEVRALEERNAVPELEPFLMQANMMLAEQAGQEEGEDGSTGAAVAVDDGGRDPQDDPERASRGRRASLVRELAGLVHRHSQEDRSAG
jgi:HK97 family phage portal protein